MNPGDVDFSGLIGDMVSLNDGLYAAFANAGSPEQYQGSVDLWHSTAVYWETLADRAAQEGGSTLSEWVRVGGKLASDGQDLANQLADTSLAARFAQFAAGLPNAVAEVAAGTLKTVGAATRAIAKEAGDTASELSWAVVGPLVILGGAVALVVFLLTRSGARVSAGPLKLG